MSSRSYIAKYAAADGALVWEAFGPTIEVSAALAVAVDRAGDVIVAGGIGPDNSDDYLNPLTVKYAGTNGMKLWERRYDGSTHDVDYPIGIAVDSAGNVVITGEAYGGSYTAKYAAADGAVLWERRGPSDAGSVAIDPSGKVFVSGTTYLRVQLGFLHGKVCRGRWRIALGKALRWWRVRPRWFIGFGWQRKCDCVGNVPCPDS